MLLFQAFVPWLSRQCISSKKGSAVANDDHRDNGADDLDACNIHNISYFTVISHDLVFFTTAKLPLSAP